MIEQEILEIVENVADDGSRLNNIADQFRTGRDLDEIIVLLDSDHTELVSSGVWILGELHFELYNSDKFVSRLHHLIEHQDPGVRFQAFGALFPALDPQSEVTQAILLKLCSDPNKGVRMSAEAVASQWLLTRPRD